ncbi:hypothetical protein BRUCa_2210 [Brucella melitensis]|uniref:Uncharacterized protein n=1 Tax=Brucella ovis (strain ATCC 25840 / 63/290 / NCTC 10512) TaxID=444178 RepID=A0A0H3AUQ8_BRUO2|nr:hypothetical protein BOV_A0036 [Brucella ovis ATCC 25840]
MNIAAVRQANRRIFGVLPVTFLLIIVFNIFKHSRRPGRNRLKFAFPGGK